MNRFHLSLIATAIASTLFVAQLATSFPPIRWGCIGILLSLFLAIGLDAMIDKAKAESNDYVGNLLTVITPHIAIASACFFAVILGVFIGW